MRSNTYRALPATLFITINVSRPLHPIAHTFITAVEMSDVFASHNTMTARRLGNFLFIFIYICSSFRKLELRKNKQMCPPTRLVRSQCGVSSRRAKHPSLFVHNDNSGAHKLNLFSDTVPAFFYTFFLHVVNTVAADRISGMGPVGEAH